MHKWTYTYTYIYTDVRNSIFFISETHQKMKNFLSPETILYEILRGSFFPTKTEKNKNLVLLDVSMNFSLLMLLDVYAFPIYEESPV